MLALALCLAALTAQDDSGWRYVVPPVGDALRRPQLRAIPLAVEKPEELELGVQFPGRWRRYGALRFGDPDSTRVAIVLDHYSATKADLYVDLGRDLSIDARDLVVGEGPAWEISLAVATRDAQGHDVLVPRRISIELGRSGAILGAATLGWLAGEVELGGKSLRVRRRDGDANGFFGDASDQLWIDRDGSGGYEPLTELFVVQPILSLDGRRFALRSNRLGTDLRLDLLEGAGKVRLAIPGPNGEPRQDLIDVQALLVGRDGSAVLARAPGEPTEVPIGEYRLGMVTVRIADPRKAEPWSYVFSAANAGDKTRWRAVGKDAEIAIDPVGALNLELHLLPRGQPVARGDSLSARPTLHTGDELLINTAYRGRETPAFSAGTLHATVELLDATGHVFTSRSSGFA